MMDTRQEARLIDMELELGYRVTNFSVLENCAHWQMLTSSRFLFLSCSASYLVAPSSGRSSLTGLITIGLSP
jgi:hypothetical protein